jgi:hypothetical protein
MVTEAMALLPWGRGEQELDDTIRIGIRQRLEKNRIHHCEDRGVDPDAESQRSHGGKGEPGLFEEHVQRMLQVVPKITHKPSSFLTCTFDF